MLYNGIQDPKLNEALVRRLGMRQDAPAPQLSGEIQPSLDILQPPPDIDYLTGRIPYWGVATSVAVAGKVGYSLLWVPLASDYIVTVTQVLVQAATAGTLFLGRNYSNTAPGASSSSTRYSRDFRLAVNVPSVSDLRYGSDWTADIGIITHASQISHPANVDALWSVPLVLGPGWYAYCVANTPNEATRFSWAWSERKALPGELNP